jgi:hypothetical protein
MISVRYMLLAERVHCEQVLSPKKEVSTEHMKQLNRQHKRTQHNQMVDEINAWVDV